MGKQPQWLLNMQSSLNYRKRGGVSVLDTYTVTDPGKPG